MPFEHIVVPVDFEAPSERAADLASAVASKFHSKLDLVHSFYVPPLAYGDGTLPYPYEDHLRLAQGALDAALARTRERYPSAEALLVQGEPRPRIIEVASERGADLIVMGTHGRGGFSHAFLGSVAERVVRTSPVPVLTAHGDVVKVTVQGSG
jgi:nucleotide-binding universal stress UspA family protein